MQEPSKKVALNYQSSSPCTSPSALSPPGIHSSTAPISPVSENSKMTPSLAGHTHVLASICDHLPPQELSQMLRVSREIFPIAGRLLYRRLVVK